MIHTTATGSASTNHRPLGEQDWAAFERDGYLRLGRVLDDQGLHRLQTRLDDIMLGKAATDYEGLLMQLDGSNAQTKGFKGATLDYRKIQGLEADAVFGPYVRDPLFRDLCRHVYGDGAIACYRAMVMNKPAHGGTFLSWHQDRWSALDRDPLLTVWTALDPSSAASGAIRVIPGSHHAGLINPEDPSGFLTRDHVSAHCPPERYVTIEAEAGEAIVLHNWLLHSSDVNPTDAPRRAFSVCYMDARTRNRSSGHTFPVVFEPVAA